MQRLRLFFSCSGIGILNRGIESFFREAFDGLQGASADLHLFKGAGIKTPNEHVLWNLPRTSRLASWIGRCIRRNPYVVEQLSTVLPMLRAIRAYNPHVIFYSDANLGFQLFRWRRHSGVPFKLLFSNGGPCHPPFDRTDFVHQVAPTFYDQALAAGELASRHFLVPYGVQVPAGNPIFESTLRKKTRRLLGLPETETVVMSVGWIAARHKRMDYLIAEVASLPPPRPHLLLLGEMDAASPGLLKLATEQLGPSGFTARCVPYAQMAAYYSVADVFTLASLQEGFGRAYMEALVYGLPVIAHDTPVTRYVLAEQGDYADLTRAGALARALQTRMRRASSAGERVERRESIRNRFDWSVLAPAYAAMFERCAAQGE